ncbi:MAG TPA: ethanolamine ammonia-lyase subunit EutB [Candidatus Angelobacter sp.]|jgi:ethanolamine ammonia-lyase large subunit|nr:ethanolamine ammonia-lyase subunit EutB [Candidatus Angelobacter sp.]
MRERFHFSDLPELLAKANEEKSGDQLAGIAARSEQERVAAKCALADRSLEEILANPVIDPDQDDVSRLILETHDAKGFSAIKSMTVGEFREFILGDETDEATLGQLHWAITPEMAAAVAKIMSNKDLVLAASKIRVVTRCRNTMGQRGVLGIRLQPNHPTDDLGGILLSALDGLLFGCGDAVIGVNPATDSVETVTAILVALDRLITAWNIPTQACCLAHVTTQLAALERGAPIDLLFQSIAGTEAANRSFGVTLSMLSDGQQKVLEHHKDRGMDRSPDLPISRSTDSHNVMYFETGQGSALSAEAHHGVDQLTLEARAYGVARVFSPFLVNTVVGFIGPEYLYDERQIIRAGLEDHFMGKLLGLPMGCDVCYTNHAAADQNSADNLLLLLAAAGCNYFMGVPCADDVMLNYQSTSFHDALAVRRLFNLQPAPEFLEWLNRMKIYDGDEPRKLEPETRKALAAGIETVMKA